MALKRLISLSDVPEHGMKAVELEGRRLLVGRAGGNVFVCDDRCPHAGVPLSEGIRRKDEIKCRQHGWEFDLMTGESIPPSAFRLQKYPVSVAEDWVLVDV